MKSLAIAGIILTAILITAIASCFFLSASTDCGPTTRVPGDVKTLVVAIQAYHLDRIQNNLPSPAYPRTLMDLTRENNYLTESDIKRILSKETTFRYFPPPSDNIPPVYPLIEAENSKFIVYGFASGEVRLDKKPKSKAQQDAAANP